MDYMVYPYLMDGKEPGPGFFAPWETAENLRGTAQYASYSSADESQAAFKNHDAGNHPKPECREPNQ